MELNVSRAEGLHGNVSLDLGHEQGLESAQNPDESCISDEVRFGGRLDSTTCNHDQKLADKRGDQE